MIKEEKVLLKRLLIWFVLIAVPIVLFVLLSCAPVYAQDNPHSAHAGKETREIKALSNDEVAALLAGAGAGYALAAELNHYPGPKHTLDLREKLGLTADQTRKIERVYANMTATAAKIGKELVETERALDSAFANRTITRARLQELTTRIGELTAALRMVHLGAHITTTSLLTREQIHQYDVERGYREQH